MPSVILTEGAIKGLERCQEYLLGVSPQSCEKASEAISEALKLLESFPEVGQIDEVDPQLRELVIPFGGSGYVALYLYEDISDQVFVLAFRHQREAGFD